MKLSELHEIKSQLWESHN